MCASGAEHPGVAVLVVGIGEGEGYAEANISAKETEEEAHSWILGASVKQGRAKDPETSPQQGTPAVERRQATGEETKLEGRVTGAALILSER